METDAPNGEQPKKTRKVKKQVRKGDLPISAGTASLDQSAKDAWFEKEKLRQKLVDSEVCSTTTTMSISVDPY